MMQQMAELVEDSLGFAVRQEGGSAVDLRRQIAADQAQVRAPFSRIRGGGVTCENGIHPRAAAFVLARIPVRVKGSEISAGSRIPDGVAANFGVPHGNARFFLYANAEDAS